MANYQGVTPDPYDCSGPTDDTTSCGGQSLQSWNNTNGDPTVDPGIQIYEDPDAQGSPTGPVYPIPSIYVGTCGVIIGGGAICNDGGDVGGSSPHCTGSQTLGFPSGTPLTNDAGQIVIDTGCHSGGLLYGQSFPPPS